MDLHLAGKTALVTGASRGIGLAIARTLAAEGAHVVAGALKGSPELDVLTEKYHVRQVTVDLTTVDGPAELVASAADGSAGIDVLVNNVGAVRLRLDGFLGTSDEEFAWSMNINFYTALRCTRAALGPMIEQGAGAIVNTASVNAFYHPDAAVIDYGAAKAALVNFTKAISQEFGPRGIRINSVSPGPVATDLWLGQDGVAATVGKASGVDADTAREQIVTGMGGFPTGRFTTPEEVASLIAILASERTGNVTGSNYVIDGGLIKTT
jgi:NAD(P)-dependent dehydrogenase (short-subunit alcohol dehydrogenase family)